MDTLNTRLEEMMCMLAKEHAQQAATEENLRQTQARLEAPVGQQNQNPTPPQIAPSPPPTSRPNSMVLAKPQPYKGSRGAVAKPFVGQMLHLPQTIPHLMTDYTETWSQPYLMKVFKVEEVAFDKFLDKFKSSFFDHNCQHCAEVSLQSLHQTGTVSAYTQEFNSHTCTVGWANTPLMILYQHGMKENIQLAMVMSKIQFTSLRTMQVMALKAG
ncbi:uncharacterized protein VP01_510g21 [Puccinia sorghi]|uniref:Retrotransposon gag domain-containing protein n=1 Tax=Puccinia sorghi TaxID=27349 RepID=A0A0L6UL85_9BASI|nr:uncharacterized protein VP01_510g21 [Puccinia sorghi]